MARNHRAQELWDSLVERVTSDDGLKASEFGGAWTAKKLFFLCNYLELATSGMKGNPKFPRGLTYVDLFCGTGVCTVELDSGPPRRYPGSALIAAAMPKPFDRLVLVDEAADSISAATRRIASLPYSGNVYPVVGDVNEVVDKLPPLIPNGSLCVAFVDPYSLDVHYSTIAKLASTRAARPGAAGWRGRRRLAAGQVCDGTRRTVGRRPGRAVVPAARPVHRSCSARDPRCGDERAIEEDAGTVVVDARRDREAPVLHRGGTGAGWRVAGALKHGLARDPGSGPSPPHRTQVRRHGREARPGIRSADWR